MEDEEDFIHPTLSDNEEIDDPPSYRPSNGNLNYHEKLNESTADFNKEIRQINQELRQEEPNFQSLLEESESVKSLSNINIVKKN